MIGRAWGLSAVALLCTLQPLRAQERTVLGFVYHGELSAEEQETTDDPVALATAAWADSVRIFLGPEVLQLQASGWYAAREGESPHYLIQIVGLPVMAGEEPTGMVVLAVTVLESDPDDTVWRYIGQSVDYYEGDTREAVPRIIETLTDAVASLDDE